MCVVFVEVCVCSRGERGHSLEREGKEREVTMHNGLVEEEEECVGGVGDER